jgi:hypothetical protein
MMGQAPPPPRFMGGAPVGPPPMPGGPDPGKAAEAARKEAYRLELEAQMRANKERQQAEKERSLQEARYQYLPYDPGCNCSICGALIRVSRIGATWKGQANCTACWQHTC